MKIPLTDFAKCTLYIKYRGLCVPLPARIQCVLDLGRWVSPWHSGWEIKEVAHICSREPSPTQICFGLGWWDGSAGKGPCYKSWWPVLEFQNPHGWRRKLTSVSCPFTSVSMQKTYMPKHVHTYVINKVYQKKILWF